MHRQALTVAGAGTESNVNNPLDFQKYPPSKPIRKHPIQPPRMVQEKPDKSVDTPGRLPRVARTVSP